jgi:poly(A) polymerase
MRIQHQPGVEPVLDALARASEAVGVRALLVGGYVRDRILQRDCKDLDVVAEDGRGLELAAAAAEQLRARPPVVFERFGTAQVSHGDFLIEFVSARAESYRPESRKPDVRPGSLEDDVWRRDFTCNALLADWRGEVIDITGLGLTDIEARLLRTPLAATETFAEDPLRAVRAIRFAATLEFRLHEDIVPAINANLDRLTTVVSVERVNQELRKMLLSPRPGGAVRLMHECGVLARLMPEVEAMAGVEQTGYHAYDVLDHTIAALDLAAARPAPRLPPALELILRLGILMHDAGKPETAQKDGERITFIGHPEAGARRAAEMMKRLRFSNDEISAVTRLVELHMRPIQYQSQGWSDGAVRRLVRDSDELLPALLALAAVDMEASDYPTAEANAKMADLHRRIDALDVESVRRMAPPLNGNDLMQHFKRAGGPWISAVQAALLEAVINGELPPGDKNAAWSYIDAHPELLSDA